MAVNEQNITKKLNFSKKVTKWFQSMLIWSRWEFKHIRVYKAHVKMVKGYRIDTGLCKKALSKIGFSKNTWNKGKLQNWYRASG